jgi:hypothetical protein
MVDPNDHGTVARIGYAHGYIIRTARGARVPDDPAAARLLRGRRAVAVHRHAPGGDRGPARPPTAQTAAARLDEAVTRDEVVEALLAVCQKFFRRVLFFIVKEPWVLGWSGAGEGVDRALVTGLRIPLDQPSIFRTVTRDRSLFIGRLGPRRRTSASEGARQAPAVDRGGAAGVAAQPRGQLVYGDNGSEGRVRSDLGELMVLLQKVPRAYLRIIRKRVADARQMSAEEPDHMERNES